MATPFPARAGSAEDPLQWPHAPTTVTVHADATNVEDAEAQLRTLRLGQPVMLDASAFPHIVERIAYFATGDTALAMYMTSRVLREYLRPRILYSHVSVISLDDDAFMLRGSDGSQLSQYTGLHGWQFTDQTVHPYLCPGTERPRVLDIDHHALRGSPPPGLLEMIAPTVVRIRFGEANDPITRPGGNMTSLSHTPPQTLPPLPPPMLPARPQSLDSLTTHILPPVRPAPVIKLILLWEGNMETDRRVLPLGVACHTVVVYCRGTGGQIVPNILPWPCRSVKDIIYIFKDARGIPKLASSMEAIMLTMADHRRNSAAGDTRFLDAQISIVGDPQDRDWVEDELKRLRSGLSWSPDGCEALAWFPISFASKDDYIARVGLEAWALETDPEYRFIG